MADARALKQNIDLVELIGRDTQLKKVASTGGGEWAGPCPFCGGRDRFRVQPARGLWWCRQCGGDHWQDAIAYVMRRHSLDFKGALAVLCGMETGDWHPSSALPPVAAPAQEKQETMGPPGAVWQARARAFAEQSQAALWGCSGTRALAWLHARRLTDDTLYAAQLGYNPADRFEALAEWGLPAAQDGKRHAVWIPRGIVIPCQAAGAMWSINIRRPTGKPKYYKIKGSLHALYLADWLSGKPDLFLVEGEFDALQLHQVAGDLVDVVTLGSASTPLSDHWLPYLLPARRIFLTHDNDRDGEKAARNLGHLSPNAQRWRPLGAHDVTDMHKAGGDLRAWVELAMAGSSEAASPPSTVTLILPADTPAGCPAGCWQRLADGRIRATYTRIELAWALAIAGSDNPAVLEEIRNWEVKQ